MTMNDIPQAPTTWCDPDQIGAPLPETDEVEADPQTVQIPPAESFEVLRRASEEELRAQERGEQLNPLESGRAAITIALTPLCQLEGAVMLGVSLLEAVVKRVEQVDEDAVEAYLPDLSAILAAQRHDVAEFSRHVNPDIDPEWLIDGCQEICVALAAHAATIGWQRPEVDVSNVFASLDMASEPDLVRTLLRQAQQ